MDKPLLDASTETASLGQVRPSSDLVHFVFKAIDKDDGLNDIEATGCIATECRSARMAFDGAIPDHPMHPHDIR